MIRPSRFISKTLIGLTVVAAGIGVMQADSLLKARSKPMFSDKRAVATGDLLTIIVQENTTSKKDNSTSTSKNSALDAKLESFPYYTPGANGAVKLNSKSDFSGGGQINNTETITSRVTVQVIDVLPNQTFLIEGRKQTKINGDTSDVILRGTVRAEDIMANNTVFSYNVANAEISIDNKGLLRDNSRPGWFKRIWDKISPF